VRALITRPQQDSEPLADALKSRGIEAVIEPLLVVNDLVDQTHPLNLDGVQAILITSANGVRALVHATDRRDLPVFAVGDATAGAVRQAGFRQVESAGGNVGSLAQLTYAALTPDAGDLLYVSGTVTAGDLTGPLERAGFTVRRAVLYDAKAADRLTPETIAGFKDGSIDIVLFFSPRTAEAFAKLARKARIASTFKRCTAYCIAQAVAMKAQALNWKAIRVATYPTQESLLELIDNDVMNFGKAVTASSVAPEAETEEAETEEAETEEAAEREATALDDVMEAQGPISFAALVGEATERTDGRSAGPQRGPVPPAGAGAAPPAAAEKPPTAEEPGAPIAPEVPLAAERLAAPASAPAPAPAGAPRRRGGFWRIAGFAVLIVLATAFGFFAGRLGGSGVAAPDSVTAAVSRWVAEGRRAIGLAGEPADGSPGGGAPGDGALAARVETLERTIAQLATERPRPPAEALASGTGTSGTGTSGTGAGDTEGQFAATARMLAEIMARVDRMEVAIAASDRAGVTPELRERLAALETRLAASEQAEAELRRRAEASPARANSQAIAALETRIEALVRDLAAARARVGEVATTTAARQAAQEAAQEMARDGEALALALGQLADAVGRGVPYTDALEMVRGFAGNLGPRAAAPLDTLATFAPTGVSTRLNLQFLFPDMARRVVSAYAPAPQDRLIDRLIRKVRSLVSVRPMGESGGALPAADVDPGRLVAIAETRLQADDLAGAVAALAELEGPAAEAAAPWVAEAEGRLKALEALRALRSLAVARHGNGPGR